MKSPLRAKRERDFRVSNRHLNSLQWEFSQRKSMTNLHLPPGFGTRKTLETYFVQVAGSQAPVARALRVSFSMNSCWLPTRSKSRSETPWLYGFGGPCFHSSLAPCPSQLRTTFDAPKRFQAGNFFRSSRLRVPSSLRIRVLGPRLIRQGFVQPARPLQSFLCFWTNPLLLRSRPVFVLGRLWF